MSYSQFTGEEWAYVKVGKDQSNTTPKITRSISLALNLKSEIYDALIMA